MAGTESLQASGTRDGPSLRPAAWMVVPLAGTQARSLGLQSPMLNTGDTSSNATLSALTLTSEDGQTWETYPVFFARAASQQNLPAITLEASSSEVVAGQESLFFTVARTGDTADELFLTINITQEQEWLSDTSHDVIISADSSSTRIRIPAVNFDTDVTESGNLTATVAAVDGYDTTGAMATVRVIPQQEPSVTVGLDKAQYIVDEGAGELEFFLVARGTPGLTSAGGFGVSISTLDEEAVNSFDYVAVLQTVIFADSDFSTEDGVLVARRPVTVTIVDDNIIEGDEKFRLELSHTTNAPVGVTLLEPDGTLCPFNCDQKYPVTIRDNDGANLLRLTVSPDRIEESGNTSATITVGGAFGISLPVDQAITVIFGGPATYGEDYTVTPADTDDMADGHQLTLEAGATEASLLVTAIDDTEAESCEWVTVSAVSAENSTPIPRESTIAVLDDEAGSDDSVSSSTCLEDFQKRPGISVPKRQDDGASMFWHTKGSREAEAPEGWKVERRHRDSEDWVVKTFMFIGADADALQTYSDRYWDWVDRTADLTIDYTYRVRAINADGSEMDDRFWSRRAPVE